MADYAGLAIAALDMFLKCAVTTRQIIQNDRYMRAYAQQYTNALYEQDQTDLHLLCRQAQDIARDQTVSAEYKAQLEAVFTRAKESLDAVGTMAAKIRAGELGFFQRRLTKLNRKIDDMGAAVSLFRNIVQSLQRQAATPSGLLLQGGDFCAVGDDAVQINKHTRLTRGSLSRIRSPEYHGTVRFILETKPYTRPEMATTETDMRILAGKLGAAPRGQCILPLVGYQHVAEWRQFQLVFAVPAGESTFQTLEDIYRHDGSGRPSLNQRLALCCELAKAVLHTHTLGLVHKHVRPANVLLQLFPTPDGQPTLFPSSKPALFLSGWQYARTVDDRASARRGEDLLERAVYQHPQRQQRHAETDYCMGHDIYSLGVCMLELLTWSPLVQVGVDECGRPCPSLSQPYREAFMHNNSSSSSGGGAGQDLVTDWQLWRDPAVVKSTIMHMNRVLVPVAAGDRMKEVIEMCLTCVDNAADWQPYMTAEGRNDKAVVIAFVETVLHDITRALSVV